MLFSALGMLGATKQPMNGGDILNLYELPFLAVTVAGAVTLTGQQMTRDMHFSGGSAHTVTLPTADQLVKALAGSINLPSPPNNALYGNLPTQSVSLEWPGNAQPFNPGSSFRRILRSANSDVTTLAAPSSAGVTISGTATMAATSALMLKVFIENSSPAITLVLTTNTGGSVKKLTNVDRTLIRNVTPGMSVYGTGIGTAAKVSAVDPDQGIIYVTVDSTAAADNIAVTFTPTVIYERVFAMTN